MKYNNDKCNDVNESKRLNRSLWNSFTEVHVESSFYDVPGFLKGKSSLTEMEVDLLGDVKGKSVLHLQCHFGLDSLSIARLGASVVGVDFSETAISEARRLNDELSLDAKFVCCDVDDLPQHLEGCFDIVFASFGVIGWHESLERWASVVAHFLGETGRFCFAEFHPVMGMLSEDSSRFEDSYFNSKVFVDTQGGSYADPGESGLGTSHSWNHSMSDLFAALESNGLQVSGLREYDYSPYSCFGNSVEREGKFHVKGFEGILPLTFSLVGG